MRLVRSTATFQPEPYITLGCDPELFLATPDGTIVGSERAIPSHGLSFKTIVQDGVQVELNPSPSQCRELLAGNIRSSFMILKRQLDDLALKGQVFTASFRSVVEVDANELAALSPAARALGCAPSFNAYTSSATLSVDGSQYRTRSAGGTFTSDSGSGSGRRRPTSMVLRWIIGHGWSPCSMLWSATSVSCSTVTRYKRNVASSMVVLVSIGSPSTGLNTAPCRTSGSGRTRS